MTKVEFKVDPERLKLHDPEREEGTGIWIRATLDGKWGSYDINALDKPSLLAWLKSRDGDNPWAEDVVGHLLGHGSLHDGT